MIHCSILLASIVLLLAILAISSFPTNTYDGNRNLNSRYPMKTADGSVRQLNEEGEKEYVDPGSKYGGQL